MTHFKNQVTKGFKWSAFSQFSGQAFKLIFSLILARLLVPEYFGQLVVANVTITFIGLFVSLGLEVGIVQRDPSKITLSTAFWINIIFGIIFAVLLYVLREAIANFFQNPRLALVFGFLFVKIFLDSLIIVPKALMSKSLRFKYLGISELIATIISGSIAIFLAIMGYGIYALIWQPIVSSFIIAVMIIHGSAWRPELKFKFSSLKDLTGFTNYWFLDSIINFSANNLDNILIGKFVNAYSLGVYNKSLAILSRPLDSITLSIGKVLFPSLAIIKNNDQRMKRTFLKVIGAITLMIMPLSIMLFVLSEDLVLLLIGEKWKDTIPLIKIFSLLGVFKGIGAFSGNLFLAKERTDLLFTWGTIRKVFIILCLIVGLNWGIIGVAWAYTLSRLFTLFLVQYISGNLVGLTLKDLFLNIRPTLISNIFLICSASLLHYYVSYHFNHLLTILITGLSCMILYVILLELSGNKHYIELKNILYTSLKDSRGGNQKE